MTMWDRIRAIFASEAKDVKAGLETARDKFDGALAEKEREAAASPTERMDMILDDISEQDSKFDELVDKAAAKAGVSTDSGDKADAGEVQAEAAETKADAAAPAAAQADPVAPAAVEQPSDATTAEDELRESLTDGPATDAAVTAEQEAAAAAKAEQERLAAERAEAIAANRAAADAKFEQQKAKAADILDDLRDELGIDDGGD